MLIATHVFVFILGFVLCAIIDARTDDTKLDSLILSNTQPFVIKTEAVNLETFKAYREIPLEIIDNRKETTDTEIESIIKNDAAYALFSGLKESNAIQYRKTVDHSRGIVSMEACIRVGVPQNDKERDYEY